MQIRGDVYGKDAEVQTSDLNKVSSQERPVEREVATEYKEQLVSLTGTALPDEGRNSDLDSEDSDVSDVQEKVSPSNLSPKIIYASVSVALLVTAGLLYVVFGPNEPQAIAVATATTEIQRPALPTTDAVPALDAANEAPAAEQALVDEELGDSLEANSVVELPDEVEENAVAAAASTSSPQQLPVTNDAAPVVEENTLTLNQQPEIAEATTVAVEVTANNDEELAVAISSEPPVANQATDEALTAAPDRLANAPATTAGEVVTLNEATGDYYIIVASFATEAVARQHAGSLSETAETRTIISPFGDSSRYRVAIASFGTRTEAQANIASYTSRYG